MSTAGSPAAFYASGMPRAPKTEEKRSVVARNVKRYRYRLGWSQEELAARAGVSSVKMIESGARIGRQTTLMRIAKALGTTISDLYDDRDAAESKALAEFLRTSAPPDLSDDERDLLRSIRVPGRELTSAAYQAALMMIRLSRETEQ